MLCVVPLITQPAPEGGPCAESATVISHTIHFPVMMMEALLAYHLQIKLCGEEQNGARHHHTGDYKPDGHRVSHLA